VPTPELHVVAVAIDDPEALLSQPRVPHVNSAVSPILEVVVCTHAGMKRFSSCNDCVKKVLPEVTSVDNDDIGEREERRAVAA
jgi:hypothetical protein